MVRFVYFDLFAEHSTCDYSGPISSLKAFGKTIIILNDVQTTTDLLDKKSLIYSERPISIFGGVMFVASVMLSNVTVTQS